MNRRLTLLMLLAFIPACLTGESILPANITNGKLVPGSTSPDNKYCLLEVFHSDTTQNSVIFATVDRAKNLGYAPLSTEWSTDIPFKRRAIILWAPDGSCIALHDSLNKHSAASIYRHSGDEFVSLTLPDLLDEACRYWKVDRAGLASSGQRPLRWDANDALAVEVTGKHRSGRPLSTVLHLKISSEGVVTIAKK
jgi:hypothetical protein